MPAVSGFNAVYAPGIYYPDPATVTALALLFEKVYFPSNAELLKQFVKINRFDSGVISWDPRIIHPDELTITGFEQLTDLSHEEAFTCVYFFLSGLLFAAQHGQLFPSVFQTKFVPDGDPIEVTQVSRNPERWVAKVKQEIIIPSSDEERIDELLDTGYIPLIVTSKRLQEADSERLSARELASVLAIRAVQLVFPKTAPTNPQRILEARSELADHLPAFWAAMLRLSVELKERLAQVSGKTSIIAEAQDLVDTTVLPSLLELRSKIQLDRKRFDDIFVSTDETIAARMGDPKMSRQEFFARALASNSGGVGSPWQPGERISRLGDRTGLAMLLELEKMVVPTFHEVEPSDVIASISMDPRPPIDSHGVTAPAHTDEPIKIFYSYAHEDEELRDKLQKHLAILKRRGLISEWHDRQITGGEPWKDRVDANLDSADIVLLLVSDDFIASDYCYDVEMRCALERHQSQQAIVIPVILRPVKWDGSPFASLQALPKDGKAITTWGNVDEAFTDVANGIQRAVDLLRTRS